MIRIEELSTGVLHVHYPLSDMYEAQIDQLDKPLREKLYVLRAADALTSIKGVGARMSSTTFWLFENEDDEKLINEHSPQLQYLQSLRDDAAVLILTCK